MSNVTCPVHGNMHSVKGLRDHMIAEHGIPEEAIPDASMFEEATNKVTLGGIEKVVDTNIFASEAPRVYTPNNLPNADPLGNIVPSVTTPREPKPIMLTYRYEGECETCLKQPTTLLVDLEVAGEAVYYCVAYCVSCNKKLQERKVVQL